MVEIIFLTVCGIICLLVAMPTLYYVQTKDYYFMRIVPHLKETGFVRAYRDVFFRLPAKSLRNLLIVGVEFLVIVVWGILVFLLKGDSDVAYVSAVIIGMGILSQLGVFIGVAITNPLSEIFMRRPKIGAAKEKIDRLKDDGLEVIGITGSYGKSSVKNFLYQILLSEFESAATKENQNSELGVSLSVLSQINEQTQYFVAEMAAYHKGAIAENCSIAAPDYGIITAIGNQHIAVFGSQQAIVEGKSELLESLPEDGMAVLPFDSKYLDYMKDRCKCRFITFSVENSQADIYATKIWRKDKYLKASVEYDNEKFRIQTELLGEHTIYNLLPAIALASEIGVSKKSIESVIGEIKPVYGKLSVHEGVNDTTLINDGYSSNEQGFKAALDVLRGFEADQKLILSKGILELGEEKDSAYKRISRKFDECDCKLITNDSLFNKYVEDEKVVLVGSENEIFEVFDELSRKNDDTVVLVEGRFSPKFMSGLKISKKERA